LDGVDGPIVAFARDLRALRKRAGNPSYRELARTALFAPSVLSSAASGHRLPTLAVTLAFVTACGDDWTVWERRWRKVTAETAVGAEQPRRISHTASSLARPAQLPIGSTTFVGRTQALAGAARVTGPGGSLKVPLVVNGPIGVGKTVFALRLADDIAAEFTDGLLYADLGSGESTNGVVHGFLRALGVPAPLTPDDQMQRIGLCRTLLAQRHLFVMLENARDERQVRPLIGRTAHSQILVTSRARLLGLDCVHRIELDNFTRDESMALFGRLIGADRVEAEYEATDTLAELCGDLPLAVNVIGRMIAARPERAVAYTAALLADRDRLMSSLSVGDVNVRDQFAEAYRLLPPVGLRTIDHLGCSGARWTTAIGLAADLGISIESADDVLESLVDAGLLTRANVGGRYCVSALVSVFAADARRSGTRPAKLRSRPHGPVALRSAPG
jgi:hypothetical protein